MVDKHGRQAYLMSEFLWPSPIERLLASVAAVGSVTFATSVGAESTSESEKIDKAGPFYIRWKLYLY